MRNTVLIAILLGATAVLPFAALGVSPVLFVVLPMFAACGVIGWRLVAGVAACEDVLNERLARWYARRAIRLMYQARRHARYE